MAPREWVKEYLAAVLPAGPVVMLALLLLGACATTAPIAGVHIPSGIVVRPPGPDVPPPLAAFSGVWQGVWDGVLDHVLIVREVTPGGALLQYCFGEAPSWNVSRGSFAIRATFMNGALSFVNNRGKPVVYRMRAGGLDATFGFATGENHARLTRVDAATAARFNIKIVSP